MSTIGCDEEFAAIHRVLAEQGTCVLVGPGGVGKSMLLRAVVDGAGPDTVSVDALDLGDPRSVLLRVAEGIDVDHLLRSGGVDGCDEDVLARRLAAADVGLVAIDHAEDVIEPLVAALARVARGAPDVRFLVGSRTHPLVGHGGVVRIAPLSIEGEPAAELFRERYVAAGGVGADLDGSAGLVDRLLERTGGLPLAIAIEAARAATLGLRFAVAAGDDDRDASTPPDDPVDAVLRRSLRDLDEDARIVFHTLGVLHSAWTPHDLAAVAGCSTRTAAAAVESLARRSLVTVHDRRVDMLPPLRRLARRFAVPGASVAELEERRAAWAVHFVSRRPPSSATDVIAVEGDLRAAVAHLVGESPSSALQVAAALDDALRADLRHGRRPRLLDHVVDAARAAVEAIGARPDDVDVLIDALRASAVAHADASDRAAAGRLVTEAASLADRSRRPVSQRARIDVLRSSLAFDAGQLGVARSAAERALAAAIGADDELARLTAMRSLADALLDAGDVTGSIALAAEVVADAPTTAPWLRWYATALVAMGEVERGGLAVVHATVDRLIEHARATGDVDLLVEADWLAAMADPTAPPVATPDLTGDRAGSSPLHLEADIARALRLLASGRARTALALAADCELRARLQPMVALRLDAQLLLGEAAALVGEPAEARRAFGAVLLDGTERGYRLRVPDALGGIAAVLDDGGPSRRADVCRAAAAALRRSMGVVPRPHPWRADRPVSRRVPARWVIDGHLDPDARREVMGWLDDDSGDDEGPTAALSPAQRAVAELVAEGHTNQQIADRLHLSRRTVETHIAHSFQRLGVRSRTQLAAVVLADHA